MTSKFPLGLYVSPNQIAEFAVGDTVDKSALPGDTVYTSSTQTLANKELDATTKITSLNVAATSVRALEVSSTGGAGATSDRVGLESAAVGSGATVKATSSAANANLLLKSKGTGTVQVYQNTTPLGDVVGTTGTQTLSSKTLTTPTIGDFTNATHTHTGSGTGGTLSAAAIAAGTLGEDRLADTANRSGSYLYGRGSAVLIDDTNATGGTARWGQRERVAQVQATNYSVTGASTSSYSVFSQLAYTLNETAGFSLNTTPDCVVDTAGGTGSYSTSTRKGKIVRVTLNGQVTTTVARDLNLQLRYDGNLVTTTCQIGGAVSLAPWVAVGYFVFHGLQDGVAANMHWWWESARVFRAGASYEGIGSGTGTYTPVSESNGGSATFDVRMNLTSGGVGDTIYCYNAIWEVLN